MWNGPSFAPRMSRCWASLFILRIRPDSKGSNVAACICIREKDQRFFNGGAVCLACKGTGVRDDAREATLKSNWACLRPTEEDYRGFNGAHCRNIYRCLPEDWRCPGCRRSKFEVLRWTILYPNKPESRRPGWAGGYHNHHDHGGDGGGIARFDRTVVCEQCNSADSVAKRKLKLPSNFSFAPWEIQRFVTAFPHGKHLIDYGVARSVFERSYPSSSLHLKAW
jgi:hypothetical protein